MDRIIPVETAAPTMCIRWNNRTGMLQQLWTVTRHLDHRLERQEGCVTSEWRDVPSVDPTVRDVG